LKRGWRRYTRSKKVRRKVTQAEANGFFPISGLARRAGVKVQTIHYYERRGLLLPPPRSGSGYRLYDDAALRRLLFIRHSKELGFTLNEIEGLLELSVEGIEACDSVKEKALGKLRDIENKISTLDSLRAVLKELVASCERRRPTEACPILKSIEIDLPRKGGERGEG